MNAKELLKKQQLIVSTAKAEGRELTAEEQKEFDSYQALIEKAAEKPEDKSQDVEAERQRAAEVNTLCRSFNVDPSDYIKKGSPVEEVRKAIMDKLVKEKAPVDVKVTADEEDKFRAAAADGLMMRAMNGTVVKDAAPGAEAFRGMSLRDLAIECHTRAGEDSRELMHMNKDELFSNILSRDFYNPSAAFPAIMDQTIRKSIVQIYQETPTTFQLWTSAGSLNDFKESPDHEYVFGGLKDFEKVPENGEIKADIPSTELLPTRKLDTYGKQFSMTRQAFINDDIGFLAAVPGAYVKKAKDTIDNQVYSILFNNGNFADGVALFHSKHSNLATTAAVPSIDGLKAMYLLMGKQTDQFGEAIQITPQYVLVGNQNQFDIYTALHSTNVTGSPNNDVNPFYGAPIQPIVVNKLDALAGTAACPWFIVANQMSSRSIQVDYLNGNQTPTIRRMEQPGTLGYVWDVYFDWGIAIRDFRGLYKNPGKNA